MVAAATPAPDENSGDPNNANNGGNIVPIDKSIVAEASSAHARINIPLNLENWKGLPAEISNELLWFHQFVLDQKLDWKEAASALGYDRSTVFRALKGTYEGAWPKIVDAIRSFRKLTEQRGTIQQNEFAENSISAVIFAGLDYAMANNSITLIVGESRSGKTIAAKEWQRRNNHGRSVLITAPPLGGAQAIVRQVAASVGVNKSQKMGAMMEGIYRAFNPNRILIVDEAHRCLPTDGRTVNPATLEFLRDLHDQTKCALALISTKRLPDKLQKGDYQYEQLIGRIGMPIRVKTKITAKDVSPIVRQFIPEPSAELMAEMVRIANEPGRLGILTETLKVASRIAAKEKAPELTENHVIKAIALRKQMSGEEGK
jgi:DNA transposition AAA+ family ATPase